MTTREYNNCVKLYADGIYRFVLKNLANEADAQDVVQNTFEKTWRRYDEVDFKKAKSFLFTVAYHDMIDLIRKRKFIKQSAEVPEKAVRDFQNQLEAKEIMNLSLEELPAIQKSLIMLRDYEGYNYEEIATITELSLSQVKVYLFRARKKMQQVVTRLERAV